MKKILLVIFSLYSTIILAQRETDMGLMFGAAYYMGDINPYIPFYAPDLDAGITYRYNFNTRYIFKFEGNFLRLGASDADFGQYDFNRLRNKSFSSKLYDIAAQFEFNFLPLKFAERKFGFSPFVSSGIGTALVLDNQFTKKANIVYPFALGARITFGKNWSLGVAWNFRKLFNDKIDGVENAVSESYRSPFINNDWYAFASLFVTYKVFDFRAECPAYQEKY